MRIGSLGSGLIGGAIGTRLQPALEGLVGYPRLPGLQCMEIARSMAAQARGTTHTTTSANRPHSGADFSSQPWE